MSTADVFNEWRQGEAVTIKNLAADKAIAKQRSRRSFRKFMEAVRSIRFDEAGNLRIIYAPPALRGLFF